MQSHYEINVALNGKHYLATNPRSLDAYNPKKIKDALADFAKRFPESEGFSISCTKYVISGEIIKK